MRVPHPVLTDRRLGVAAILACAVLVAGLLAPAVPWARAPAAAGDLRARVALLESRLDSLSSKGPYLVIDTVHNLLEVRQGRRVLAQATCATGSGRVLLGDRDRIWRFNTPVRAFRVVRKVSAPIWKKPEWAFVEVGRKAPVLPWEFDRLDGATLGDYALELGEGYEIHGTLYPNLLGRHITHGCIRLGDRDLAEVYQAVSTGTPVYTY